MAFTSISIQAAVNVALTKTNTGFKTVPLTDSLAFSLAADVATYTFAQLTEATIAGGANTTIDLFGTLTDLLGGTVSAKTKLLGVLLTHTGTAATASLKVEPGASNPISLGLSGTTPAITQAAGGCILLCNAAGSHETIDATHRNLKLSNPGSTTITYNLAVIVG